MNLNIHGWWRCDAEHTRFIACIAYYLKLYAIRFAVV